MKPQRTIYQKEVPVAELKPKVELKSKGESAELATDASGVVKQVITTLSWKSETDLDFMAFIEKKDGSTFGVLTDLISKDKATMGDLQAFPFMSHSGDEGVGGQIDTGDQNDETIKIAQVADEVAKVRLVAFNYTATSQKSPQPWGPLGAKVTIKDDAGNETEAQLNSPEQGVAALVATLDNTSAVGCKMVNESKLYANLDDLLSDVPGAREALT